MPQHEAYCFYEESLPEWKMPRIMLAENSAGELFYPVRPIIAALGVDRPTQTSIIKEDTRLKGGKRDIKAPTRGGPQDMLYLRQRETAIWIALIDPVNVAPAVRGQVEEFQTALWSLADRIIFRRRRGADATVETIAAVIKLEGELHGDFICECGRRHVIEISNGEMRVYHR